jgi:hypothetical protein
MMRLAVLTALCVAVATDASARLVEPGTYLCSVEQLAFVSSTHLEDADPPIARGGPHHYRFRINISNERESDRLVVEEAPYDGPERSLVQWEDDNSTLHAPYVGDGYRFDAVGEVPGFLRFARDRRWGDDIQFYHSSFQYAGGEDIHLNARWGRCQRE